MSILMLLILTFLDPLHVQGDKIINEQIATVAPFNFLVEGPRSWVTTKSVKEIVEFNVAINFNLAAWTQVVGDLNHRFRRFEELSIFSSDADLKNEFLSYSSPGFNGLEKAEKLGSYIMKFKNEQKPHNPLSCTINLFEFDLAELTRLRVNLDFRASYLLPTWTAESVKASTEAQELLLSWVSVFNDGIVDLIDFVHSLMETLENLSDGHFPAQYLGERKSCHPTTSVTEGEHFEIIACAGHNNGFSCNVTVTQPTEFMGVWPLYPIVYENIRIQGSNSFMEFFKNVETHSFIMAECDKSELAHPMCEFYQIPPNCKHSLEEARVADIINFCNFTLASNIPSFQLLEQGGVLIQESVETLTANGQVITEQLPLIIYSPGEITITQHKRELKIHPEAKARANIIISSAVSSDQLTRLKNKLYWEEVSSGIGTEDYIDLSFLFWELLTLPCILFGLIRACKRRTSQSTDQGKSSKKRIYKENIALLRK